MKSSPNSKFSLLMEVSELHKMYDPVYTSKVFCVDSRICFLQGHTFLCLKVKISLKSAAVNTGQNESIT